MAEESKASSSQTAKSGDKVFWNVRDAGGSFSKQEESRDKKGNTPSGYLRFADLQGNYSRLEAKMLRSRRRRLAMKMRELGWSDAKILGLLNKHPDSWPTMSDLGGSRKVDPKEAEKAAKDAKKAKEKAERDKEKAANKAEREANKAERKKEKAAKDKERAANKAKAAVEKARKLKEREAKKAATEAKKSAREKQSAAKKAASEAQKATRAKEAAAKKAAREKGSAAKKAKAASTKSREQKLREQIAELKKKQSAPGKKVTKVNAEKQSATPSAQAAKVTPKLKTASKAEFDKSIAKVSRMTLRRIIDKLEADPSPAAKERAKWARARLETLKNRD